MIQRQIRWGVVALVALSLSQSESLVVSNAPGTAAAWSFSGPPPLPVLSAAELERSVQCLALNIYHEARSEPEQGQRAVAAVTLNRAASGAFPRSICAVVEQGGRTRHGCQFSWRCDRRSDRPQESAAWRHALSLSRQVLSGAIADPTGGATYYHADYARPSWSASFEPTARIGRHIFYPPPPP